MRYVSRGSWVQVFDEVCGLVTSVLDGFNVCIMAYGQTGSGKTHTMEGPDSDPGVNSRALQELFRCARQPASINLLVGDEEACL